MYVCIHQSPSNKFIPSPRVTNRPFCICQDNFFIHHVGAITMYGVCDGHGPFGHLVSFRLVQTLPFYLSKSDWCSLVLKMFDVIWCSKMGWQRFSLSNNLLFSFCFSHFLTSFGTQVAEPWGEHFGKNWEEALKEAFQKAQEDLEEFCNLARCCALDPRCSNSLWNGTQKVGLLTCIYIYNYIYNYIYIYVTIYVIIYI
jgi:hypothetical protein